jgi:hypothetical protein
MVAMIYFEVGRMVQTVALLLLYGLPWLILIWGLIRVVRMRAKEEAQSQEKPREWRKICLISVDDHHILKERNAWIRR